MFQLALRGVSKMYGRHVVFDDVSLTVRPGEHLGVVGDNGAGKSTLLRLMAGIERPSTGRVVLQADGGVGYLSQTLDLPRGATVAEVIDRALAEFRAIEREVRQLESKLASGEPATLARYSDLVALYESRGGYQVDASMDAALIGLALGHVARDRELVTLSGGELRRLALACVLVAAPPLLLLDEPTNHMDDACLEWLEQRLRVHRGTLVAVSHDRLFLERIATAILEVDGDQQSLVRHGDGYAGYLREKANARRRWQDAHARWRKDVQAVTLRSATTAREVGYARRKDNDKIGYDRHAARVDRQVASRVRNAEERLRRLIDDPVQRPPDPLEFKGRFSAAHTDGALLALEGARVDGRLDDTDLVVAPGERVLITGPNGAGKTTLLRLLAGDLEPERGAVRRRGRLGYLPQDVPAMPSPRRLLHVFAEGLPGDADEHLDRLLSLGLFREDDAWVPVERLSVGQRQRLALARLLLDEFDVLLLDEPTNHLAPDLVEALEEALLAFPGALVLVTHDRLLRQRLGIRERRMLDGRLSD
ncbi:MAG TPA: ABC-F family ATP-binding cassette domain-containing protein [Chloroflexota bacterium]